MVRKSPTVIGEMSAALDRERGRRLKIKLAALRRHKEARGPDGRSELAVKAGRASGIKRESDTSWGLEMALRRWYPDA